MNRFLFGLFLCIGLFFSPNANALTNSPFGGQVKLAWDASPSPGVAGYNLYAHTNSFQNSFISDALVRVQTTNLTVTVQFTNAQPRWYFIATAVSTNGLESVPSNEVIVESPPPPANARTVAIEYTITISGTNWSDVGFFRLRLY